jgi:hypothetical protein
VVFFEYVLVRAKSELFFAERLQGPGGCLEEFESEEEESAEAQASRNECRDPAGAAAPGKL